MSVPDQSINREPDDDLTISHAKELDIVPHHSVNIPSETLQQSEEQVKLNNSLFYALLGESVEEVIDALSLGAEVNCLVNFAGLGVYKTPLSEAVCHENLEFVKVLLDHNADPNMTYGDNMMVLFNAVQSENAEIVKVLLEHSANVDHQVYFGCTYDSPLTQAVKKKNLEVMKTLLEHGTNPSLHVDSRTALSIASSDGDVEVVRLLLKYKADPNIRDTSVLHSDTPLFTALAHGHIEVMKVLLEYKADPTYTDTYHNVTLLNRSIQSGNVEIVQLLLEQESVDPNIRKQPALCESVERKQIEVLKCLLDHGVDPNVKREYGDQTALYIASEQGNSEIVKILLDYKADPSIANNHFEVPLYIASYRGNVDVVKAMMDYGIDPNMGFENVHRKSSILAAVHEKHLEVMTILLKHNADPNTKDQSKHTLLGHAYCEMKDHPEMATVYLEIMEILLTFKANTDLRFGFYGLALLHLASQDCNIKVVKLLLQYNADPNIMSIDEESKETPLCKASENNHVEVVEILLAHGADPNITAEVNETPLYISSKLGHVEVVETLLEHGADPNITSEGCDSPLSVASEHGNVEIVKILLKQGADGLSDWEALQEASSGGQTAVLEIFFEHNIDPNLRQPDNQLTALHVASTADVADFLIDHGADISALSKNQSTVLHSACHLANIDTIEYFIKKGLSLETHNKRDETPVDMLLNSKQTTLQEKKDCLQFLKDNGYYKENEAPIADLSTEISFSSPSIDKMDYGLSLDVDPSFLSQDRSGPVVADIKVFTVDNEVSPSFTFPEETKPVSAVYTISLSVIDVPLRTLRIRHCVDPNSPEQLEQLMFVKSSDDSSNILEIVPGGIFKLGEQYGEITPPHMCSWSIVGNINKLISTKASYQGTVLYRTVKEFPDRWLMELIVGKHNPKINIALNEYINSKKWDHMEKPFVFTFEDSAVPKLDLLTGQQDSHVIKYDNGWEIAFETQQISQQTVDLFRKSTDVPGVCTLHIHTHKTVCHELSKLPFVKLSGIISDKNHIRIDPPASAATKVEPDSTNVKPKLRKYSNKPTVDSVFGLMKCHSARWEEFARQLGLCYNDRELLYVEPGISADTRLERIIDKWIESECSPVTWDKLTDVMKIMGFQDVVDIIVEAGLVVSTLATEDSTVTHLNTTIFKCADPDSSSFNQYSDSAMVVFKENTTNTSNGGDSSCNIRQTQGGFRNWCCFCYRTD